ncbi:MAG: electron transport complex subunit RsxB [Methylococcaceae bacterium]|jgi:electron transport complex protein RnfB|nr:electron transport complex subunit RsxB [Methylococcaceae bacterium]
MAIFLLSLLFAGFGLLLGYSSRRITVEGDPLTEKIDALLPQTQCGQCGYPGCRPYAAAIARDAADINQCPPGGEACVIALAELLGREAKPLDPAFGNKPVPAVAYIHEPRCIGCALCLQVCPVDAILGAPKFMHTVIAAECTGCELCVPVCPVDCIEMLISSPPRLPGTGIPVVQGGGS